MTAPPPIRVLFVDDEPLILEALERSLGDRFEITVATGGAEGLAELAHAEFDVISSDMRMPGMDGAAFLNEARRVAPRAARVLLTGHTDLPSAMAAVNRGQVHRFLTKPCAHDELARAIEEACALVAQRDSDRHAGQCLCECVRMLGAVMAMCSPAVPVRSEALARIVRRLADAEALPSPWLYETAALLSLVGTARSPETSSSRRSRAARRAPKVRASGARTRSSERH